VALEVDPPHLGLTRLEANGAERDVDFRGPALAVNSRRSVPHALPIAIDVGGGAAAAAFAFVEDLLLELGAKRRGQEHVAVARIVKGVEDDLEVVFVEQAIGIAPHFRSRDRQRRIRAHADVEMALVVKNANLGAIGGRRAFLRLLLEKAIDDGSRLPGGLIEDAVNLW
jgi:hypothetical protein